MQLEKFASHIGCEPHSKNEALGARRRYFCIENIDVALPVIENAAVALPGQSRAPSVWRMRRTKSANDKIPALRKCALRALTQFVWHT